MANQPATPGVYIQEIATLPPSVAEVSTAVPAFIGYTETTPVDGAILRVSTMLEFETAFGGPQPVSFEVTEASDEAASPTVKAVAPVKKFCLYYALSHYFRNGGGPCYVVSVGDYGSAATADPFLKGLGALEREDEPTLIVLTDAASVLSATDYYTVCGEALAQCKKLGDRFAILDVQDGKWQDFRSKGPSANLMYGAAYHPYLQTSIPYQYRESDITIKRTGAAAGNSTANVSGSLALGGAKGIDISFSGAAGSEPSVTVAVGAGKTLTVSVAAGALTIGNVKDKTTAADIATAWAGASGSAGGYDIKAKGDGSAVIGATEKTLIRLTVSGTLEALKNSATSLYNKTKAALNDQRIVLPPSAAVAGIYARVDREQGVWKTPANVGVQAVLGPVAKITNDDQDQLNVDPDAGKSINAIRDFTGKGTLVWGGRTLAGNDNEWRYISVRRLFITIEESAKKASAFAVFEANDQSTWLKVKAMIESYLYSLWERGALAGAKPEAAYYVHVGLGTTMTPQDVLEGRMIVEIGVAAVRPAEFIVLRFSHKLQTA
jgi:phage tail sheath protein FI